jgi:hypothetical protein
MEVVVCWLCVVVLVVGVVEDKWCAEWKGEVVG